MNRMLCVLLTTLLLGGCASGLMQPFGKDPVSGGVDKTHSDLLGIAIPVGMQAYPSHSQIDTAGRQGLETMRGYVDQMTYARTLYDRLRQAGWQLRMRERMGQRGVYIYQKDNTLAALVFRSQGALTILEIWAGPRLQDSAADPWSTSGGENIKSIAPEHYEPIGKVETFGPVEREL